MGRILYIPKYKYRPIIKYGLLYNYWIARDANISSSDNWIVPNHATGDTPFYTLLNYLGDENSAGGHLKETGTAYWTSESAGCDNSSLFNGRGSGNRDADGTFSQSNNYLRIATSQGTAYYTMFSCRYDDDSFKISSTTAKMMGFSIRLLKTSTALSNGQSGLYTGNDGKVYRTICIGTQEWLADNLAETKYRNGDLIPFHGTDNNDNYTNSEWAALTTGALCAYNNNWANV